MKIRLSLTLQLERAPKPEPAPEYREVDIPATQADRMPEPWTDEAEARRVGFVATTKDAGSPE